MRNKPSNLSKLLVYNSSKRFSVLEAEIDKNSYTHLFLIRIWKSNRTDRCENGKEYTWERESEVKLSQWIEPAKFNKVGYANPLKSSQERW